METWTKQLGTLWNLACGCLPFLLSSWVQVRGHGGKETHCLSPSPRVLLRWGPPASQISWVTFRG